MKDNLKLIVKNAGISFGGQLGGTFFRTLYHLLIANLLGAASYGLYSLGLSIVNVLTVLSIFGLNMTAVKYISEYMEKKDLEKTEWVIRFSIFFVFFLSLIFAMLMFFSSREVSIYIFKNKDLVGLLRLFSLVLVFQAMLIMIVSFFRGFKELKYSAFLKDILQPISSLGLFLFLYYLGFGLYSAVYAFLFSTLISVFIGFYLLNYRLNIKVFLKKVKGDGKELLKFSFPILLLYFTVMILNKTDIIMLGYFKTSKSVGIYSFVYRISYLLFLFWFSFNSIFSPVLSSLFVKKEFVEADKLFKIVSRWIFTLTLPFSVFFIVNSDIILGVFKKEYRQGMVILIIFSIIWLILSFSGSVGNVLIMLGKREKELLFSVPMVLINIVLNYLLIPKYGIVGACISTGVSLIGFNFIKMFYIKSVVGIFPLDREYLKPILSLIFPLAFIVIFKNFIYLLKAPFFFLVTAIFIELALYFLFLIIFKLPKEDQFVFHAIKGRIFGGS